LCLDGWGAGRPKRKEGEWGDRKRFGGRLGERQRETAKSERERKREREWGRKEENSEPEIENWRVQNRERRQKKKSTARTPAAAGNIQIRNGTRNERAGHKEIQKDRLKRE